MNEEKFREIALSMDGAVEGSHMGKADFRANGRIFATLWGDEEFGMVKLTPEQQEVWVARHPDVFAPVKGKWGEGGATRVTLKAARVAVLREVMGVAWGNQSEHRKAKNEKRAGKKL